MDSSWLWKNEQLSDVRTRLICPVPEAEGDTDRPAKKPCCEALQDGAGSTQGRPGCLELPGHSIVLACVSGYWKARILRWEQGIKDISNTEHASAAAQPTVLEETVDSADQLQAAEHVLCYAYTRQFAADLSVPVMRQMAITADKWDMPEVVSACLQKAASQPLVCTHDINMLLDSSLPGTLTAHHAYEGVTKACAQQLLRAFGRTQAIMFTPGALQAFCSLSLPAVQLWAKQDELQVDSENTVAVLFTYWWGCRKGSFSEEQSAAVAAALTSSLRALDLTRTFAFCIVDDLPWFKAPKQAMQIMRVLYGNTDAGGSLETRLPYEWASPSHHEDKAQLRQITWEVTRAGLDQLHKDAATGEACISSPFLYWRGYTWQLCLQLDGQGGELLFGVKYCVALPAGYEHANPYFLIASFCLTVDTKSGVQKEELDFSVDNPMESDRVSGSSGLLGLDWTLTPRAHSHPPDALWHADGKLHLGLKMRDVS